MVSEIGLQIGSLVLIQPEYLVVLHDLCSHEKRSLGGRYSKTVMERVNMILFSCVTGSFIPV